jgi:hypothetical protein
MEGGWVVYRSTIDQSVITVRHACASIALSAAEWAHNFLNENSFSDLAAALEAAASTIMFHGGLMHIDLAAHGADHDGYVYGSTARALYIQAGLLHGVWFTARQS